MAIYMWRTWPWIYHNSSLWLISISWDGSTWITIADKNLWATNVYNDWDTLSESNCWKYYQRWNNYGFAWTWTIITSSTTVDTSTYWPWNYYSSSTFITRTSSSSDWSSVQNDNLRWYTTWTLAAMQWPCPIDFHVPTDDERTAVKTAMSTLWIDISNGACCKTYLKVPFAWYRTYNNTIDLQWKTCFYRTVTPNSTKAVRVRINNSVFVLDSWYGRSYWNSLRPFKNVAVQPDESRTVLYQ
jgi:hypothetical protein